MNDEDEYFDENLGLLYMDGEYDDLEQTDRHRFQTRVFNVFIFHMINEKH